MRFLSKEHLIKVNGGQSTEGLKQQAKETMAEAMPYIKQLPKAAYYAFAISSVVSGGSFAAPAAVTLLYYAIDYNDMRFPVGAEFYSPN